METAIQINILIIKTFIRLRRVISTNKELLELFKELEKRIDKHDFVLNQIIGSIEKMIAIEDKPKRKMGFVIEKE